MVPVGWYNISALGPLCRLLHIHIVSIRDMQGDNVAFGLSENWLNTCNEASLKFEGMSVEQR